MNAADFLPTLMFYVFSGVMLLSAVAVIVAKNPVHSVLFLIFAFFNAAGLFLLAGAEFLAMILVIVYVGAVAVLFLFVVMMLNINFAELKRGFVHYLPLGALVWAVLLAEMVLALRASQPAAPSGQAAAALARVTNTHALGAVLYTFYVYPFQLAGLILLVAMIGAIVLTLRHKSDVRRQRISSQVHRNRKDAVEIVKVQTGQGI